MPASLTPPSPTLFSSQLHLLLPPLLLTHLSKLGKMTLVTRSAIRVARRGAKNARANAALFTTAAKAATALPQPRVQAAAPKVAQQGK